jgi:hypothetical protein
MPHLQTFEVNSDFYQTSRFYALPLALPATTVIGFCSQNFSATCILPCRRWWNQPPCLLQSNLWKSSSKLCKPHQGMDFKPLLLSFSDQLRNHLPAFPGFFSDWCIERGWIYRFYYSASVPLSDHSSGFSSISANIGTINDSLFLLNDQSPKDDQTQVNCLHCCDYAQFSKSWNIIRICCACSIRNRWSVALGFC